MAAGGFCTMSQSSQAGEAELSIVETAAATRLDVAAAFLALEPALLGGKGWPCCAARRRPHRGFAEHFDQPIDRVLTVALLGAEALGLDHDDAVLGHAL